MKRLLAVFLMGLLLFGAQDGWGQQPADCVLLASGEGMDGGANPGPFEIHSTQYCIQVPAGALALQIDVESVSGGDLDFFVSFGAPIDPLDLFFTADFAQISDSISETLTIDQNTFPPLEEGVYYIALGNVEETVTDFRLTASVKQASLRCVVTIQDQVFDKVITLSHDGQRWSIPFGLRDDESQIAAAIAAQANQIDSLGVILVGTSLLFDSEGVSFQPPFGVGIPCAQPGAPIVTDLQVPTFLPGAVTLDVIFSDLEDDVSAIHVTLAFDSGRSFSITQALSADDVAFGVVSLSFDRQDFQGFRNLRGDATVSVQLVDETGLNSNTLSARTQVL